MSIERVYEEIISNTLRYLTAMFNRSKVILLDWWFSVSVWRWDMTFQELFPILKQTLQQRPDFDKATCICSTSTIAFTLVIGLSAMRFTCPFFTKSKLQIFWWSHQHWVSSVKDLYTSHRLLGVQLFTMYYTFDLCTHFSSQCMLTCTIYLTVNAKSKWSYLLLFACQTRLFVRTRTTSFRYEEYFKSLIYYSANI